MALNREVKIAVGALAALLAEKGVITMEEYSAAVDEMIKTVDKAERKAGKKRKK